MKAKPTLYELLGLPPTAAVPEVQAAYRREMNALDARRAAMPPQDVNDRAQLLRLAYSTLVDPVSRAGYDAKLEAAARATPAGAATRGLALRAEAAAAPAASAEVRAEALALRADALSLRADAMLVRAGLDVPRERHGAGIASGMLTGVKRVVRAIGLLVVVGAVTFGIARCSIGNSAQKRAAVEAKAAEQAALQEYYQTYGVRPANMAELELLEAARRRKENEQRQAEQNRRAQEQEQRRFEEDSRRRADQVTQELRSEEQRQRWEAERERERERQLKMREEQLKLEAELANSQADRRRIELHRQQLREQRTQP